MKFIYFRILTGLLSIAFTPALGHADLRHNDPDACTNYSIDLYVADHSYTRCTECEKVEKNLVDHGVCTLETVDGIPEKSCNLFVDLGESKDELISVPIHIYRVAGNTVAARNKYDEKISAKQAKAQGLNVAGSHFPAFTLNKCGKRTGETFFFSNNRFHLNGLKKPIKDSYLADLAVNYFKHLGGRVLQTFNFYDKKEENAYYPSKDLNGNDMQDRDDLMGSNPRHLPAYKQSLYR